MTTFIDQNRRYLTWIAYLAAAIVLVLWLGPLIGSKNPARWVQTTITGVLVGGIYSLIALGIVVINKASGVFNFARKSSTTPWCFVLWLVHVQWSRAVLVALGSGSFAGAASRACPTFLIFLSFRAWFSSTESRWRRAPPTLPRAPRSLRCERPMIRPTGRRPTSGRGAPRSRRCAPRACR